MTPSPTAEEAAAAEAMAERLFEATVGTLELFGVYLGSRLGLYQLLADGEARTAPDVAREAGIDERYAREWLEQQAVAGFLTVDDATASADIRRYALPAAYVGVLATPTDPSHMAPFSLMTVGIAAALSEVAEAYRTGEGVPYENYGKDMRHGQGGVNRPTFSSDLTGTWIPTMSDIERRLRAPGARIADVACGHGWSSVALATAYPDALVLAYDLDEASIVEAEQNAAASGVGDRLRFSTRDATEVAADGPFDLVCVLEALHDMSRPVETLAALRQALSPDGVVLVCDERVADSFTAPGDPVERMMYGWSISHCLPASRAEQPSAALGTVMRAATVRSLAAEAGFQRVQELPVTNDFFRLYRLGS